MLFWALFNIVRNPKIMFDLTLGKFCIEAGSGNGDGETLSGARIN